MSINASKDGVEVTFSKTVAFEQGSVSISEKAKKTLDQNAANYRAAAEQY